MFAVTQLKVNTRGKDPDRDIFSIKGGQETVLVVLRKRCGGALLNEWLICIVHRSTGFSQIGQTFRLFPVLFLSPVKLHWILSFSILVVPQSASGVQG